MNTKMIQHGAVALVLAFSAVACGKSPTGPSEGGNGNGNSASVTSVAISGTVAISEGATSQLKAVASKSDGSSEDVTSRATWQSSDPTVATVSATGLVTALRTGTADVTAVFSGRSGRSTLQISAARYTITLTAQSVTALGTCDNPTQGLTSGEFAVRVLAVTPGGSQTTLDQTASYPGNPGNPRGYNLAQGASQSINTTRTFTLDGTSGQFVRVQFNATEWDEEIVVFPPSTRWVHDDDMDDRSTSRTHSYVAGGSFGSLGPNTLTLGNSSCGIRLSYTISAVRQ